MTTTTQEQLAASRMLTARLHVELAAARDHIATPSAGNGDATKECLRRIESTLDHGETDIIALLARAEGLIKLERLSAAALILVSKLQGALEGARRFIDQGAFIDTEDQLRAISDVLSNADKVDPVSRLIEDARMLAEHHGQDSDELGLAARRISDALGPRSE